MSLIQQVSISFTTTAKTLQHQETAPVLNDTDSTSEYLFHYNCKNLTTLKDRPCCKCHWFNQWVSLSLQLQKSYNTKRPPLFKISLIQQVGISFTTTAKTLEQLKTAPVLNITDSTSEYLFHYNCKNLTTPRDRTCSKWHWFNQWVSLSLQLQKP